MSTGLIEIMKRASMDAMDNAQMCDVRYGTVTSTSPLSVKITNLFTIPSEALVVPKSLTNHTVEYKTEQETSRMKATVYNALRVGDKVALLRLQGGQSYLILDRI